MTITAAMKTCTKCRGSLPTSEFYRLAAAADGLSYYCKPCVKVYQQRWRERNRTNKQVISARREKTLKKLYGITPDRYDAILDAQGRGCAICTNPPDMVDRRTGKPRSLAVDHCHVTGEVRGLLCANCNQSLGHFKDDTTIMTSAVQYLQGDTPILPPQVLHFLPQVGKAYQEWCWKLRTNFGISANQYEHLLSEQGGVCALCQKGSNVVDRRSGRPRRLSVDHCHATGAVRGLLCLRCNAGLGKLKDDPALVERAVHYLTEHR